MKDKKNAPVLCPHCGKDFQANELERHIVLLHPGLIDPTEYIRKLTRNSTIQSLYRSARRSEQRGLRSTTFAKFRGFENEVTRLSKLYSDKTPRADLAEGSSNLLGYS